LTRAEARTISELYNFLHIGSIVASQMPSTWKLITFINNERIELHTLEECAKLLKIINFSV